MREKESLPVDVEIRCFDVLQKQMIFAMNNNAAPLLLDDADRWMAQINERNQ